MFADHTRAAMCAALMNGQAWTPSELSEYCSIARSTATEQINTLCTAGIVREVRQGRHRYVAIANEEVAGLIEHLAVASNRTLPAPHSLNASRANTAFYRGRTCYKHLAGELGTQLLSQAIQNHLIGPDGALLPAGNSALTAWGVNKPRQLRATLCMDTTHRVFHVGGPLGQGICQQLFANDWLRRSKHHRAVMLTDAGRVNLATFGFTFASC